MRLRLERRLAQRRQPQRAALLGHTLPLTFRARASGVAGHVAAAAHAEACALRARLQHFGRDGRALQQVFKAAAAVVQVVVRAAQRAVRAGLERHGAEEVGRALVACCLGGVPRLVAAIARLRLRRRRRRGQGGDSACARRPVILGSHGRRRRRRDHHVHSRQGGDVHWTAPPSGAANSSSSRSSRCGASRQPQDSGHPGMYPSDGHASAARLSLSTKRRRRGRVHSLGRWPALLGRGLALVRVGAQRVRLGERTRQHRRARLVDLHRVGVGAGAGRGLQRWRQRHGRPRGSGWVHTARAQRRRAALAWRLVPRLAGDGLLAVGVSGEPLCLPPGAGAARRCRPAIPGRRPPGHLLLLVLQGLGRGLALAPRSHVTCKVVLLIGDLPRFLGIPSMIDRLRHLLGLFLLAGRLLSGHVLFRDLSQATPGRRRRRHCAVRVGSRSQILLLRSRRLARRDSAAVAARRAAGRPRKARAHTDRSRGARLARARFLAAMRAAQASSAHP
mmetsp:Transcript_7774/g.23792  ORF Transcript_7774/g.23792 Transcript_7774/m.23792 type:complete len:504 (+) Transcript_7774:576-2087(+)